MNEFIVWDDIRKEFAKDVTSFLSFNRDGTINCFNGFGDTKYFKAIGLKDINQKSIYADSSIIEFKNIGSNYTGYFTFDIAKLCYKVIVLNIESVRKEFIFNSSNIENIKIIDNIQENKLGLIKPL